MRVLPPSSMIGIVGGGQLGRMMAIAAAELGYRVHIYTPEEDSPASHVAAAVTVAPYDDMRAMLAFAGAVDVVTFEFENIPHEPLKRLAEKVPVYPNPEILYTSQNRVREKRYLNGIGVATAAFNPVYRAEDMLLALRLVGSPAILKTAEMGYDGKGQVRIDHETAPEAAWKSLNTEEGILEAMIDFKMEISVVVARGLGGECLCYVPVENRHKHHILDMTFAPAPISKTVAEKAEEIARHIASEMELVGVMAVEMFVTKGNEILVNELAPRPHNSGHWTIDACITSQFEQAIRAICGLPLGSPDRHSNAVMKNLIGDEVSNWRDYASQQYAKVHLYGKKEARPGRKMGHVTTLYPKKG